MRRLQTHHRKAALCTRQRNDRADRRAPHRRRGRAYILIQRGVAVVNAKRHLRLERRHDAACPHDDPFAADLRSLVVRRRRALRQWWQ